MILKANGKDITSIAGSISLSSSIDTLGDQLDFEIAYSTSQYFYRVEINVGDIVQIFDNGKEVFRGIVVEKTRNEKSQTFNCFDFAFYLNKSKVIKQFNNTRADTAIKQLLSEFKVPVGSIASMPIVINKIYYDKEVSAVIDDILNDVTNVTGRKYVKEMNDGKFYIFHDTDLIIDVKVKLASNLAPVDINKTISNPSKKASIEDMKNSIKLYTSNNDKVAVIASLQNTALISKYGLLEETKSLSDKDIAQAKNIAKNLLNELGRVIVEGNIEVIGSFELRAGRILTLNEPVTNLVGKYKIKSVTHSISPTKHTASLDLMEVAS